MFVHAEIAKKQGKTLPHICKGKERLCFLPLLLKLRKITNSWGNCHWGSLLHRFYALIFLFVKALRQWWQIREAMKRWNRYCSKKLKQWSNEAFNAGKEIEAMKRLTLHRIASSLHRFIASSAQLWYTVMCQDRETANLDIALNLFVSGASDAF